MTAISTPSCGKRMLAYYGFYDSGNAIPYNSSKIPYNKLTHIIEDNLTLDCTKADGSLDLVTGAGYVDTNLISSAHAAGVKVLMEVANDFARTCTASTFSTVAASATYRTNFANNVYNFCVANGYDGVDIDWEQPETAAEGANCTLLIQALRAKMPSPWIISMAIPALPAGWTSYNVPALIGSLDWINVMSYDFNEGTSKYTAHVSPELQSPADTQNLGALSTAIDWYIAQGVPASKLNAGMAFYGYDYPTANALWESCASCNPSANQLFYGPDIKPKINAGGWTDHADTSAVAHYLLANSGNGFITYDSADSIAAKVNYSLGTRGVGGVFMWELSQDYDGASQDLLSAMYTAFASQCGGATATPTKTFTAAATATKTFTPVPPTATFTPTTTSTSTVTPTFTKTLSPTPTVTPAATLCQNVALALYEYPDADWTTANAGNPVYSLGVANPNSGPGAAYDPTYQTAITQAQTAGVTVIGYVHTSYSTRSIATVEAEIDSYYSFYPSIDGIFLDEVSNDGTGLASYYTPLYAYIKAKPGKHFVVINPGSQTTEGYMAVCDTELNFEHDYTTYVSSYSAPSWITNYPASRFWHIIYSAGTAAQMQNAVTLSRQRNAGYVEVTDQGLPNPYAMLPSYWSSELTAVGAPCLSPTPTKTNTPSGSISPTGSITPTFSPTKTNTATLTVPASSTWTFTPTSTNTPVPPTVTPSPTKTGTPSATPSGTSTYSPTPSWTATNTLVPPTATRSFTPTSSSTGTSTATFTATPSPTRTNTPLSPTATSSFTPTATFTSTSSFTNTSTVLATSSSTSTASYTPTRTDSTTPTLSATLTATPTASPTRTFTISNTLTFTPTSSFTFTSTGTSTFTRTNTATPTSTSTVTPTHSFTFTQTPTRSFTSTPTPGVSGCSGIPAWNGNFVYYATGSKVTYNGELYQCIQGHTSEPNWMPSVVPALWQDLGSCSAVKTASVYPNPSTSSDTVSVTVPLTATSDVSLEVFTTNFRKVIHKTYPQVWVGTSLPLDLRDNWGGNLANGLYYILARAGGHSWTVKLLVLH